jgi:hypothetical protein
MGINGDEWEWKGRGEEKKEREKVTHMVWGAEQG